MHDRIVTTARKRSADPAQEHLRDHKDKWNKNVTSFISRVKTFTTALVALKKAINGQPSAPLGLGKGNIKYPLSPVIPAALDNLANQYSQLAQDYEKITDEGHSIVNEQEGYSKSRRKGRSEGGTAPPPVEAPTPPEPAAEPAPPEALPLAAAKDDELVVFAAEFPLVVQFDATRSWQNDVQALDRFLGAAGKVDTDYIDQGVLQLQYVFSSPERRDEAAQQVEDNTTGFTVVSAIGKEAASPLGRAWTYLKTPFMFGDEDRWARKDMLKSSAALYKSLGEIGRTILSRDPNAVPEFIYNLENFAVRFKTEVQEPLFALSKAKEAPKPAEPSEPASVAGEPTPAAPAAGTEKPEVKETRPQAVRAPQNKIRQFIKYVGSFYGPGGVYEWGPKNTDWDKAKKPISGPEIEKATNILLAHYGLSDETHPFGPSQGQIKFDGGSHDREIVRDIILALRGTNPSELEHGAIVARMIGAPPVPPASAPAVPKGPADRERFPLHVQFQISSRYAIKHVTDALNKLLGQHGKIDHSLKNQGIIRVEYRYPTREDRTDAMIQVMQDDALAKYKVQVLRPGTKEPLEELVRPEEAGPATPEAPPPEAPPEAEVPQTPVETAPAEVPEAPPPPDVNRNEQTDSTDRLAMIDSWSQALEDLDIPGQLPMIAARAAMSNIEFDVEQYALQLHRMEIGFREMLRGLHTMVREGKPITDDIYNDFYGQYQNITSLFGNLVKAIEQAEKAQQAKQSGVITPELQKFAQARIGRWLGRQWLSLMKPKDYRTRMIADQQITAIGNTLDKFMDSLQQKNVPVSLLMGQLSDLAALIGELLGTAMNLIDLHNSKAYILQMKAKSRRKTSPVALITERHITKLKRLKFEIESVGRVSVEPGTPSSMTEATKRKMSDFPPEAQRNMRQQQAMRGGS